MGEPCSYPTTKSQADPFLISFLPWEMKWLGKASLLRIPIAGWSMALAGDIPIKRGEGRSAKGAMDRCKQWLQRGVPVIFFPEGTRSPDGKMGSFKDGAFRLALDGGPRLSPSRCAAPARHSPSIPGDSASPGPLWR